MVVVTDGGRDGSDPSAARCPQDPQFQRNRENFRLALESPWLRAGPSCPPSSPIPGSYFGPSLRGHTWGWGREDRGAVGASSQHVGICCSPLWGPGALGVISGSSSDSRDRQKQGHPPRPDEHPRRTLQVRARGSLPRSTTHVHVHRRCGLTSPTCTLSDPHVRTHRDAAPTSARTGPRPRPPPVNDAPALRAHAQTCLAK